VRWHGICLDASRKGKDPTAKAEEKISIRYTIDQGFVLLGCICWPWTAIKDDLPMK
jgi:hypothetical protein